MPKYKNIIDPHVHLRGKEYSQYPFLQLGFRDAIAVGIAAVGEQPNPNPSLTNVDAVKARLEESKPYRGKIFHWIHIGMTNDLQQNEASLKAVMSGIYGLRSDKTFNTHSTGNMGITDHEKRKAIMFLKGEINYTGVSIFHPEDETLFTGDYDPQDPKSHSIKQNERSETSSIEETVRNAIDGRFKGILYFAHVSSPDSICYINSMRNKVPFEMVIEETWHHMLLNADQDYPLHGNRVKMNPPLRNKSSQERVLEHVLRGDVDVIGSDHAGHPVSLKDLLETGKIPPSGIPALPFWPKGIELLRDYGISKGLLDNLIFNNSNRIFNLDLEPKEVEILYNPDLWTAYGWNPFSRIDGSH
ncbi:MAG: hypothetical protein Q8Q31_04745 [Nanoarchaeota archaeon]|nr:hypothetical protein [Nanoarchaeota archaeon]